MYKLTYYDYSRGVAHIVAMPKSANPFTACGAIHLAYSRTGRHAFFVPGVATCVACWAREFVEWEIEARQQKGL